MLSRNLAVTGLVALLGFLTLYPMSMLLYGSLHSTPPGMAGEFNLDGYRAILTAENFRSARTRSALARQDRSRRCCSRSCWPGSWRAPIRRRAARLEVLITLPFFIPPILTAMAWGMLGNPQVGVHQSRLAMDDRLGQRARQRLFLWRRRLAHDAIFDAVPVPVHCRGLPRHGPGARRIEPHVRRLALADLPAASPRC